MQTIMFMPRLAPKVVLVKPVPEALRLVQELRIELVSYTYQLFNQGASLPPGQIESFAKKYAGSNYRILKKAIQGLAWYKKDTVVQIVKLLRQLNLLIASRHDVKHLAAWFETHSTKAKITDKALTAILDKYLR